MNSEIKEALKLLNIPVTYRKYSGKSTTYITFFAYDDKDEEYSDDETEIEGYYPQIDLWSDVDNTTLKQQIKLAMKNCRI
jgi:hypothetical protein